GRVVRRVPGGAVATIGSGLEDRRDGAARRPDAVVLRVRLLRVVAAAPRAARDHRRNDPGEDGPEHGGGDERELAPPSLHAIERRLDLFDCRRLDALHHFLTWAVHWPVSHEATTTAGGCVAGTGSPVSVWSSQPQPRPGSGHAVPYACRAAS